MSALDQSECVNAMKFIPEVTKHFVTSRVSILIICKSQFTYVITMTLGLAAFIVLVNVYCTSYYYLASLLFVQKYSHLSYIGDKGEQLVATSMNI